MSQDTPKKRAARTVVNALREKIPCPVPVDMDDLLEKLGCRIVLAEGCQTDITRTRDADGEIFIVPSALGERRTLMLAYALGEYLTGGDREICSEFAAELIMPSKEFRESINRNMRSNGIIDVGTMAKEFGVHRDAVMVRLRRFGNPTWNGIPI